MTTGAVPWDRTPPSSDEGLMQMTRQDQIDTVAWNRSTASPAFERRAGVRTRAEESDVWWATTTLKSGQGPGRSLGLRKRECVIRPS